MSNTELEASAQPPENRPEWLESNFTSVEAQAKAYADARREMQQQQARAQEVEQAAQYYMERATELEQLQAEQAAQAQQSQQYDPGATMLQREYQNAVEMGDAEKQLQLNTFIASQIADQRVQAALEQANAGREEPNPVANEFYALQAEAIARQQYDGRYGAGEWDANKEEAAQWLATEAPEMIPETLSPTEAANRLVWAAEYVQGRKHLTATEQERNQMAQARQQRLMAQSSRGVSTPPPTVETDEERWAQIANAGSRDYSSLRRG